MTKKRTRRGSTLQSGKHSGKRRQVTANEDEWTRMDAAAEAAGEPWAAWAKRLLLAASPKSAAGSASGEK